MSLKDLTLTDGAPGANDNSGNGGCVHVDDGSNVEIVGCTMKNCVATGFGGAVYAASSSLLVLDSNLES